MHTNKATTVALIIGGISLLSVSWFVFWGLRDGMPGWAVICAVLLILFAATLTWLSYRPSVEQVLADALMAADNTRVAQGTVVAVKRLGVKETESYRETRLELTLQVPGTTGQIDAVKIAVDIEDALLAYFATGSQVNVLQDPENVQRVAIDRRRSPTHVN